jgi:hypothetical protein
VWLQGMKARAHAVLATACVQGCRLPVSRHWLSSGSFHILCCDIYRGAPVPAPQGAPPPNHVHKATSLPSESVPHLQQVAEGGLAASGALGAVLPLTPPDALAQRLDLVHLYAQALAGVQQLAQRLERGGALGVGGGVLAALQPGVGLQAGGTGGGRQAHASH